METLVERSYTKIRKLTGRSQKELRDALDGVLAKIAGKTMRPDEAEIFYPLCLAILGRQPKQASQALDCIEKLISYGYLRGTGPVNAATMAKLPIKEKDEDAAKVTLMDAIVTCICSCNDHHDEEVQLQVLKAVLQAVTSRTCDVHEHSLLKSVRACYHIHLVSKNTMNQTVAKATLQQMVSVVFQRMEHMEETLHSNDAATPPAPVASTAVARDDSNHSLPADDTDALEAEKAEPTHAMYPDVVRALHLHVAVQHRVNSTLAKSSTADLDSTAAAAEDDAAAPKSAPLATTLNAPFPSLFHKDAFLLFRSLCRISMRSLAEDAASTGSSASPGLSNSNPNGPPQGSDDPFAFQSKLVSLDLLLSILNNGGPTFRDSERFITLIKQYLCVSLLQNCTSNYTQIVELSLRVFVVLIAQFKAHLKSEMEVFITNIFLGLLESENSSMEHKLLVLEVLKQICLDGSILGEIFLNYDCDWNSMDLFKRIVDAISKIAKGKKSDSATPTSNAAKQASKVQDTALVLKGLECLTAVVGSLKKVANISDEKRKMDKMLKEEDDDASTATSSSDELAPIVPADDATIATTNQPLAKMSAVEAFDKKKRLQEELAEGILKFNLKPTDGVKFLVAKKYMENTPRDVAKFLHEQSNRLDKTMVGDYLGKEVQYQNGFCLKVLHEFVDMMDYMGLQVDEAIRHFLTGFRLPGESQKIDRMMEKFAERYCSQNPGIFPSADTAFILSFSIIMLQTDLHNPSIPEEKRMTKEGFIRNNRGINNGEDLAPEFLGGIYDRIKSTPISLKEDVELKKRIQVQTGNVQNNDRMRREAYSKEREAMVKNSEALFKRRGPTTPQSGASPSTTSSTPFQLITDDTESSYVRPMFEIVWAPLLACCSVIFETTDSASAITLCIDSFKHAIHLSSRLNMPSERDAFISILAKFTGLATSASREIRWKHVEAVKAVVYIAVHEGNYLGDAWRDVLQCLSHLARLQSIAQGSLSTDQPFLNKQSKSLDESGRVDVAHDVVASTSALKRLARGSSSPMSLNFSSPSAALSSLPSIGGGGGSGASNGIDSDRSLEEENSHRVAGEIDPLQVDRVFSSSVHLTNGAIQDLVLQLCVVSLTECAGISGRGVTVRETNAPRVFSLQKLVEVADMNMHVRSRVVWASVWKVLTRHFTTIGCHDNLGIAMYAIDSLKQLSMKFLEKDELRDFNFQRLFLAPFEIIMANAVATEIRELVLSCVQNMILGRVRNIKSGWKTIWGVLRVAAETYDPAEGEVARPVVAMGFSIAQMILTTHFDRVVSVFVDAIECLLAFAVCGCDDPSDAFMQKMAHDAINVLAVCLTQLATGHVIEQVQTDSPAKRTTFRSHIALRRLHQEDIGHRYQKEESADDLISDAPISPRVTPVTAIYTDSQLHTRLWWPILTALATLGCDKRPEVRQVSLDTLFGSLHLHGPKLSPGLWNIVFKGVLIPLINDLRQLETATSVDAGTAPPVKCCRVALCQVVAIFGQFYDNIGFLPELLFCLGACMTAESNSGLACAAATTLENLLVSHGLKFPENVWGLIADEVRHVMAQIQPTWILSHAAADPSTASSPTADILSPMAQFRSSNFEPPGPPSFISMYPAVMHALKFQFSVVPRNTSAEEGVHRPTSGIPSTTHLLVLLTLQSLLGNVLTTRLKSPMALSPGHASSLLTALKDSYVFARQVNDRLDIRTTCTRAGWVYPLDKPVAMSSSFLPQEMNGKWEYIRVLFAMVEKQVALADTRQLLKELLTRTIGEFLLWSRANSSVDMTTVSTPISPDEQFRSKSYVSVVVDILHALNAWPTAELKLHLPWLYPLVVDLVRSNDHDIRNAVHALLSSKVSQVLAY
ncbi:hypothetical protein H310_13588 [Aphanomyces invadans]|uniref:SEC7 domain-containing protein n=1 Tax=Aphanomyces invadans TaxID=157072 RepID=A0A024TEP8_9STRA|nr:hypothetical protein H310_13588 [Aphanomyces invadans]ETV92066.1 hypothetical protein H310_13588 [Aphanomyces invadans]|eukprot:XP_008879363.1 hypothetical protein H310_13588 [Aphanomyces invadans]